MDGSIAAHTHARTRTCDIEHFVNVQLIHAVQLLSLYAGAAGVVGVA